MLERKKVKSGVTEYHSYRRIYNLNKREKKKIQQFLFTTEECPGYFLLWAHAVFFLGI